jgi:hypothetical protein
MPDGWEVSYGLDPLHNDAAEDPDGDRYGNYAEYLVGKAPDDAGSSPQPPEADAGPDQRVLVFEPVTFDGGGSSNPHGTEQGYEWSFGDGTIATGEVPTHIYTEAGDYDVTLTVTDDYGVRDQDTASVAVLTPAEFMEDLIDEIREMNLSRRVERRLLLKVGLAFKFIRKGHNHTAIRSLERFMRQVEKWRNTQLTREQVELLTQRVERVVYALTARYVKAVELIQELVGQIEGWNMDRHVEWALLIRLRWASRFLEEALEQPAVNLVKGLMRSVERFRRWNKITDKQGRYLKESAREILDTIAYGIG